MLYEYIEEYKKAMKFDNKKAMAKIEKDLARLGMDKRTLLVLVSEFEQEA